MPDYIGDIEVPEITPSGVFPITPDYGYGHAHQPHLAIHRFGSANSKIEQRFLLGTGAKRFTVRRAQMREADRVALRNFWELQYGPYGAFTYNAPDDDGDGTTAYTCHFANEPLSWEFLSDAISSVGITLVEIPTTAPEYTLNSTVTRFPSSGLKTALLSQVQEIIPLIKIQPRDPEYSAIYVSDRRCTIGAQPYLPRLLEFDGISQSMGNESDQARFTFGNADRVMRDLANDVDLFRASIEFSLFHVGTGIKLDLWKGEIVDWTLDSGQEFSVTAADGMYELTLPYPTRRVTRTCWKCFDDGNGCPFTAQSTGMDYAHFPAVAQVDTLTLTGSSGTANVNLAGGLTKLATFATDLSTTASNFVTANAPDYLAQGIVLTSSGPDLIFTAEVAGTGFTSPAIANASGNLAGTVVHTQPNNGSDPSACDKGYDTNNGCLAHGMKHYFGGILAEPQGVRVKDNSQGTWGYGRPTITATSIVQDSIYDELIPEIYTDGETYKDANGTTRYGRPVSCKIAAGREESDFYEALGIVGEGPLTFGAEHKLDNQYNHGYPGAGGLRTIPGNDPAGSADWFSLDESGDATGGDFRKVCVGGRTYKDNFAAGTAALVIRRNDDKGIQLTYPNGHEMQAVVLYGLQGWVWTAPETRTQEVLSNPIWIVVNMMLRARGLRFADAATAEQHFDVAAAIAAAAICNEEVTPFISRTYRYWVPEEANPDPPPDTIPAHWEGGEITSETQFVFQGLIREEKPLRDWIQEVLMNCLGYYSFAFGKLKLGVRVNSSVVEAFTAGNVLFQSLRLSPLKPAYNHLTANFGDAEFNFAGNSVTAYDVDHARLIGGATAPLFLKSQMNLAGVTHKSQAARIISSRLREELGGITADQWKRARQISLQTTILALNTEPGMVCSMTHPDMPDGVLNGEPEPTYGEFRVTGWKLNKDYSIDIEGRTTVDQMYDLVDGPKPADVGADAVPIEIPQVGIPDDLEPLSIDPALHCTFGCRAWKYKENVTGASFRAKYFATQQTDPVDLRTVDEGGTMVHDPENGMYVVDDIYANYLGAQYEFDSAAEGYWYFIFKLWCPSGGSVWSNGERKPEHVTDCLPTDTTAATGPPSDWWVEVIPDENAHRVKGRASRPKINGGKIWRWIAQIRDNRSGEWYNLDRDLDPLGPNSHYGYIGAEPPDEADWISHTCSLDNRRFTRDSGVGLEGDHPENDDYAHIGDIIMLDPRGATWDRNHCSWGTVDTIQGLKTGYNIATATYFDVAGRFHNTVQTGLRLQIVVPPWDWKTAGYFGAEPNHGIFDEEFWSGGRHGDKTTEVFETDWIDVPADVPLSAIEARVWFDNGYSTSDDGMTHSTGLAEDTGNPSGASGLLILTHEDDPSIPAGQVAMQFNRDTANYKGIYAVAVVLSAALPAEGPYDAERTGHADCTIETGTCTVVKGDKSITVTRAADPDVAGRSFLIYTDDASPDSDLDGNVVASQAANSIILTAPFNKSGTFDYAIVKRWWDRSGSTDSPPTNDTENLEYAQFSPAQCAGDIEQTVWRTPAMAAPSGDFYATVYGRNKFGVGTRLTAGSASTPEVVTKGDCIALSVVAGEVDTDASLGRVFSIATGGSAITINNPTGLTRGGQAILWVITGAGAISVGDKFNLRGASLTRSGGRDMLGAIYNATADKLDCWWSADSA